MRAGMGVWARDSMVQEKHMLGGWSQHIPCAQFSMYGPALTGWACGFDSRT
jgi:hypothetical protein